MCGVCGVCGLLSARRCKASLFTERDKFESTAIRLSGFEFLSPVPVQSRHHGAL